MADYGSKITDKAIAEVMKKLRKIYEQASKELNRKMKLFTARHQAKQKKMLGTEYGRSTENIFEFQSIRDFLNTLTIGG